MQLFKYIALVLLPFAFSNAPSQAEEPQDSKAAAYALFEAMNMDQALDQMLPLALDQMMTLFLPGNDSKEELIREILTSEMSTSLTKYKGDFKDLIAAVYQQNFTADEIRALVDFMETPVGQKFVSKQVILFQQSSKGGQVIGQKMALDALPRIKERFEQERLKTPG